MRSPASVTTSVSYAGHADRHALHIGALIQFHWSGYPAVQSRVTGSTLTDSTQSSSTGVNWLIVLFMRLTYHRFPVFAVFLALP